MIYVTYATADGSLVEISAFVPAPNPAHCTRAVDADSVDVSAWNTQTLRFDDENKANSAILSKLQFRRLFTPGERELIDEFNATFESNPLLTAEQKRRVRTGIKNFDASTEIDKADPDIPLLLNLYTLTGLIAPGRAAGVLA